MLPNTLHAFGFTVKNPAMLYDVGKVVSIEASGVVSIPKAAMVYFNSDLLGIPNGANPFVMVKPQFLRKIISQTNPFAGFANNITLSIKSNIDIVNGTLITLSGFPPGIVSDGNVHVYLGSISRKNSMFSGNIQPLMIGNW